jgi:hypothetical protein
MDVGLGASEYSLISDPSPTRVAARPSGSHPTHASSGGATRRRERRAVDGHRRGRCVAYGSVADDDRTPISQKEILF